MKKSRVLFLVAATGLIFANSGCTSKSAEDASQVVETADTEKIEVADASPQGTDPALDAALAGTTGETTTVTASTPETAAPTLDETSLNAPAPAAAVAPPAETIPPTEATTAPPPIEIASEASAAVAAPAEITETPILTSEAPTPAVVESKPKAAPAIKKIGELMPYQNKEGAWINTVYIARPKEKLLDISMKIFGADKTEDLKKITENSYLKVRSPRAGDKIFYTSPNRPEDSAKTMLYYEDMGMMPETYVAKKGESLRKVSKALLGYDNAWKELWASNAVESKTSLKDGETLRYWMAPSAAPAPVAMNSEAPKEEAKLIDASQAPQQIAALPPPPTEANANLPPPPDMAAAAPQAAAPMPAAEVAPVQAAAPEATLPPPPTENMTPPPPPPAAPEAAHAAPKKKINLDEVAATEEESGELDSDTLMSMGALGVLVALLAFVIIRKKKQKAAQVYEMSNQETGIGIS